MCIRVSVETPMHQNNEKYRIVEIGYDNTAEIVCWEIYGKDAIQDAYAQCHNQPTKSDIFACGGKY